LSTCASRARGIRTETPSTALWWASGCPALRPVRTDRGRTAWWLGWAGSLGLSGGLLALTFVFASALAIPAPDGPVVRPAVLLAFEVEPGDIAEDVQPGGRVASDLDLRLHRSKRIEGLIEQVAHRTRLWHITSGTNVADRQIVIHAHVALDEASHLPIVGGAVIALEDQDVAAAGGTAVALASALVVGMRQCRANPFAQRRGVLLPCGSDAVRQTSFFHGAPCRTA